jgi:ubiquinone biosynthesis protein
MMMPSEWGPSVVRGSMDLADLMLRLPKQTTRLLEQVERGQLEMQMRMPDMNTTIDRLDRIANRLALAILAAAFTVGIGLVVRSIDLTWPWGWLTWFVIAGFVGATILGLWVMVDIWRTRR